MDKKIYDYKKEFIKLINTLNYKHAVWQVFSDFLEISAIAISNAVDIRNKEEREKKYLETINKYNKKEQTTLAEMLACLTQAMEEEIKKGGTKDVLGEIFHELELHNKYKGQFFTPPNICEAMGMMSLANIDKKLIQEKGFITLGEPCCGSGAMILGFTKALKKENINYCKQLLVTAEDIDLKCVHMTYLQLSLYGIPAVVIHGNTLTQEQWSIWYTPIYILDGWMFKKQNRIINTEKQERQDKQKPNYNIKIPDKGQIAFNI